MMKSTGIKLNDRRKRRLSGRLFSFVCILLCAAFLFAGCGGSGTEEPTTSQEQTTETTAAETEPTDETVRAADPMSEEEKANDDSGGCIEDSEDLLY
jgi:PBP1b-binding outer membrane lipoprotein LpoB